MRRLKCEDCKELMDWNKVHYCNPHLFLEYDIEELRKQIMGSLGNAKGYPLR